MGVSVWGFDSLDPNGGTVGFLLFHTTRLKKKHVRFFSFFHAT